MEEVSNELLELCYIANKRNTLNRARMSALGRKHYYLNAIKIVQAWTNSDPQLNKITHQLKWAGEDSELKARLSANLHSVKNYMERIRKQNPKPKKWIKMGTHKLKMLALKAESEYVEYKYKTMELTISTRNKVSSLKKELGAGIMYDNGYISNIFVHDDGKFQKTRFKRTDIKNIAEIYEANRAVEKMLTER